MRHRAAAHLTGLDFLLEILVADVRPNVFAKVHQDDLDAANGIAPLGQPIVMFDLRGDLAARQPEAFTDKPVGKGDPICVRIRRQMRIKLPRSSTKLGRIIQGLQFCQLNIQAIHENSPLFAQCDRGCWLAMGARQHRNVPPLSCLRQ